MTRFMDLPHLSLWTLLILYHELDDAIGKLEDVADTLPRDTTRAFAFHWAVKQLRTSCHRLETALEDVAEPTGDPS